MKILLFLFAILISFPSFGLTRQEMEVLLRVKNTSLNKLESGGNRLLMGEVTGHNSALPFSKVQILITEDEAILKQEISAVDFKGVPQLGNVIAVHAQGQYVLKQDVKAVIISGQ